MSIISQLDNLLVIDCDISLNRRKITDGKGYQIRRHVWSFLELPGKGVMVSTYTTLSPLTRKNVPDFDKRGMLEYTEYFLSALTTICDVST